jgi:hypothetical protein
MILVPSLSDGDNHLNFNDFQLKKQLWSWKQIALPFFLTYLKKNVYAYVF